MYAGLRGTSHRADLALLASSRDAVVAAEGLELAGCQAARAVLIQHCGHTEDGERYCQGHYL